MFLDYSHLLRDNPAQLHYGIAITDVDQDGDFEIFVAGSGCRNQILKWRDSAYYNIADDVLADGRRYAIGVAAADFDGDGMEEIYILNTDTFSSSRSRRTGDRIFDFVENRWIDLFSIPAYRKNVNQVAGRSVVAVDRRVEGRYGFFVVNYGSPMRFYELDDDGALEDIAGFLGMARVTGGCSATAVPMFSRYLDIFVGNEGGSNYFYRSNGEGHYDEVARQLGLPDSDENPRGISVINLENQGKMCLGLVYGNRGGQHRLFVPGQGKNKDIFQDIAPAEMAKPSNVRTVIAADFDNDGHQEIFFNNLGEPNRLFGYRNQQWVSLDMGEAEEAQLPGTGAAIGDFNHDGRLELIISHGEVEAKPLSLYAPASSDNHWLRVLPRTRQGAPARGATVTLHAGGRKQLRVIDSGSGYLCQMEPVAHFGLGNIERIEKVEVRWVDGHTTTQLSPRIDCLLEIPHPIKPLFEF